MTNKWKPSGWRQNPIVQAPEYPDKKALEKQVTNCQGTISKFKTEKSSEIASSVIVNYF
jgi:3-deoxy-D-arabino-heptulosonate 7-phosphate (DAHP) synthase class II